MESRRIKIQVQIDRCKSISDEEIIQTFKFFSDESKLVNSFSSTEDIEEGYINLSINTNSPKELWNSLKSYIQRVDINDNRLMSSLIIVCEGEDSWNDYLLLYHFDEDVETDDFSEEEAD